MDDFLEKFACALPEAINFADLQKFCPGQLWQTNPQLAAAHALARCGKFDVLAYNRRYPDVQISRIDPILHYVKYGYKEGRSFVSPRSFEKAEVENKSSISSLFIAKVRKLVEQKRRNKVAVYSAMFGSYDQILQRTQREAGIDYFLFTNENVESSLFHIIKLDAFFPDNRLCARCFKSLPHIFLTDYDYTIWIDSSTIIRGKPLLELLSKSMTDFDIAIHTHFQRSCAYAEIQECLAQKKDSEHNLVKMRDFLIANKYPVNSGLFETAQVIRRNCKSINLFNETWWSFIKNFSIRDQISVNYALFLHKLACYPLPGTQWSSEYFKNNFHNSTLVLKSFPKVEIIILMHNQIEITAACIDSIYNTTRYPNYTVTLVDNASDKDVFAQIYQYIDIRRTKLIRNEENLSFSQANNNAFKESDAEYILFLNNDTEIIDEYWLNILVNKLENNANVAAVGPLLLYPDYTIQSAGIDLVRDSNTVKIPAAERKDYRHETYVGAVSGACLLARKSSLSRVNCFDIIYHYGQEDIDLCLKLSEIGFKILFTPATEVIHKESLTRSFDETTIKNREKIRAKWRGRINQLPIPLSATINYKTYNEMCQDIARNVSRIPPNVDMVVGVPRSGMIPAYYIASLLNVKCLSFDEFVAGITQTCGDRELRSASSCELSVLLVDDSISLGNSLRRILGCAPSRYNGKTVKYNFLAVYGTDRAQIERIASGYALLSISFLVQLPLPRIFQWNYKNHSLCQEACYDLDGVLCIDPDESENDDGENYRNFLLNARPLYIPKYPIHSIVTSRLSKYRVDTEIWLKKHNVKYQNLFMLGLPSKRDRLILNCHASFKSEIYKKLKDTVIFYESNNRQAQEIFKSTGKPVICIENDKFYQ